MAATATETRPLIKRPANCKYKTVLSVDGGAIRGIIPTMVLKQLETCIKEHILENKSTLIPPEHRQSISAAKDFDIDLVDYFDLVAGTSVGSWITLYLAARGKGSESITNTRQMRQTYRDLEDLRPGSVDGLLAVFLQLGQKAFPRVNLNWFSQMNPCEVFKRVFRRGGTLIPDKNIEDVLKQIFSETMLSDLETSALMVSFDLLQHAACSFLYKEPTKETHTVRSDEGVTGSGSRTTDGGRGGPTDVGDVGGNLRIDELPEYRIRDVARASSAAPGLISPAKITPVNSNKEMVLTDGLVVANNPSMQALTAATKICMEDTDISDIALLSLGTGRSAPPNKSIGSASPLWWLVSGYFFDIFSYGTSEMCEGVMSFWLTEVLKMDPGQFLRIQFRDDPDRSTFECFGYLADEKFIGKLREVGTRHAEQHKDKIQDFVRNYIFKTKD